MKTSQKYTLFLDDEREPIDDRSVVCRSFDEAVKYVEDNGTPTHVDFDHDLGSGRNGWHFSMWLVERALDGFGFPESYSVHSQNPVGAKNISDAMDRYYKFMGEQNG